MKAPFGIAVAILVIPCWLFSQTTKTPGEPVPAKWLRDGELVVAEFNFVVASPGPDAHWSYMALPAVEGRKATLFVLDISAQATYSLAVVDMGPTEHLDARALIDGIHEGLPEGWRVQDVDTGPSAVPMNGSTRYKAILQKAGATLYEFGYVVLGMYLFTSCSANAIEPPLFTSFVRSFTLLSPTVPSTVASTKTAVALAAPTKVTPTHIGQHQIGESPEEWHRLEPNAIRQVNAGYPGEINIAPHWLGETFAEWLKINQLDLYDICQKHRRNDTRMDFKSVCKTLSSIRDTGSGDFYTIDPTARTLGWRFLDGKVTEYSYNGVWYNTAQEQNVTDNELHTTSDNRAYTWKFLDRKLSVVDVTPDWMAIHKMYNEEGIAYHPEIVPAFQEEVNFLTQIYGTPSTVKAVAYHNAYGAQWERSEVVWYAPDGTQIVAFERTGFNQQGQLELVSFLSKDAQALETTTKPNPYNR